ncbi:LysR family transcriptional regulator [Burkholderiales bacterium 8X]|nr:LysR family transcriptional regulator [Burkholderiales bacterium 8X]
MEKTSRIESHPPAGAEERLVALGIELPRAPMPAANYVTATRSGRLIFLAGQGPMRDGKVIHRGRVGTELTIEEGYQAARLTILNSLAILRQQAGSLDRVTRILKLLAWVQCDRGFHREHLVVDGASDLLVEVFGERGRHARSAVSAHDLPFDIAVEIELVAELDSDR